MNATVTAPAKPAISGFERYLSVWVALCIVVGIALGYALPGLFAVIASAEVAKVNLVVAVLIALWRTGRTVSLMSVPLALILGGAVGNLYDRIWFKYVVDFLEVHIVHYHWPDFNVADSCIVVGACLLLLELLRPQRAD